MTDQQWLAVLDQAAHTLRRSGHGWPEAEAVDRARLKLAGQEPGGSGGGHR